MTPAATDTERIAARLRLRTGWEGIDLGFRLVREFWRPVFGAWALLVWPFCAVVILALQDQIWLAAFLLWWAKPVYDRIVLHVIAQALFGRAPTPFETARALPEFLRSGMAASLLWLRLSPVRSVVMPVLQLEHLTARRRRERQRVLTGRESNPAIGLLLVCLHFELFVMLGLDGLSSLLVSEQQDPTLGSFLFGGDAPGLTAWTLGFYVLAVTVIEPFYAGGGFGLYVSRRVYLEGWDIDLAFRRLTRRAAALASTVLLLVVGVSAVQAEELPEEPLQCTIDSPSQANICADEVLATEEFSTTRELRYWVPKGWDDADPSPEDEPLSPLWSQVLQLFAQSLRGFAWLLLALAVATLLVLVLRGRAPPATATRDGMTDAPDTTFGVDLDLDSLPDDVVAAARGRWQERDAPGAISLLYRGALRHVVRTRGLTVRDSATEGECERLVRRHLERELSEDFALLTRTWQLCAYADQDPPPPSFDELCRRWGSRFGASA